MAEYGVIVEKNMRSKGIGKQLLNFVLNGEESINEQNPRAVGFYEYMGVETYKRTDLDEEGNIYPLLYMKKKKKKSVIKTQNDSGLLEFN